MNDLQKHFSNFRNNIIGIDKKYNSPYGLQQIVYGDWIASGRLYQPIEEVMSKKIGPYVANTHTESNETATLMTNSYHHAQKIIKEHVNAGKDDVIITGGNGMTSMINKFQRILGLKTCGKINRHSCLQDGDKPVVFITHMEHHSNQTSWLETVADVVVIQPGKDLLVDLDKLRDELKKYSDRKLKIGAFTACSNVTGISTPINQMARIMHEYEGVCIVDYAASAPYVDINMHPEDPMEKLDAIVFSPHKFLGGPGSCGVLVFDSSFYKSKVPDNPGGGTVDWTNPWGEYKYIDNIEMREDGGTPGFLQTIRAALCIKLKDQMKTSLIKQQEDYLLKLAFDELDNIPNLKILANNVRERLGVISFYFKNIHYNLVVKLLSDRFGIQVRGGCACAGTYGHYLLNVSYDNSKKITRMINSGDLSEKPGWIRLSLHPTMTKQEINYICNAIKEIEKNHEKWSNDYDYNPKCNEFKHISDPSDLAEKVKKWFEI